MGTRRILLVFFCSVFCSVVGCLAQQPAASPAPAAGPAITLGQAIDLALKHNHALLAARTQIQQSQAQEVTAATRANPTLSANALFIPFGAATAANLDQLSEFDLALGYTFERGGKRKRRMQAARDATAVVESQVKDNERAVTFNTAQQYIDALLARSNVDLAQQDLDSFQNTVNISREQYRAGALSERDLLKIEVQLLQFQTDLSSAKLNLAQAMVSLRQLLGYESVPENYELADQLAYQPLKPGLEDLQARALQTRPDLRAAQQGITAAKSQYDLARANGKRDLTGTFQYSHVSSENTGGLLFNMELPIFDRNQGEIARTRYVIAQAQETEREAGETVMSDIHSAYEAVRSNQQIVELYEGGYLKQAQDSRDISAYAYQRGAASLLDFLDAERSYRASQLGYRQALSGYMLSMEQLRQAVGTRDLQ